ncbi:MAG: DUF1684 domain-containing protein [Melioribacteraceae bacterium]|nr:DUF1684 domain-containing protein [Melioribacteraceae bacterium]MCF8355523.1 DUF1684 domain-containing protein [Melioribacteraceae bacterium]MCF8394522.1 DUF1684 domain-containing protein [Melioribacteraceae bacterium]MCF8420138.1 DUF1684 domain-containing protein [Melioribacteraceae bacterium]
MNMLRISFYFLIISVMILIAGCGEKYTPEEQEYIREIQKFREEKNLQMKNAVNSPFNNKKKIEFEPLNYFDVDPSWVYKSKMYHYEQKDTITVLGTKGEERKSVRFGYVKIERNGKVYNINVYQSGVLDGKYYFGIWFTDKTTGDETYGVGRYIDFQYKTDPEFKYTIDFNMAYNPYCAYNSEYSCAIPTKEDYIDLAITAGEKKFHD